MDHNEEYAKPNMLNLENAQIYLYKNSRRLIYLFVVLFVGVLFFTAQLLTAYVFSIWDKARVEKVLSEGLQRQVSLGDIAWHIDLRGLAFNTKEITVRDKDFSPFFHADKTTVLFGIIPLLHGRLRVKHLDVEQPQISIKRLTQDKWNFSDLQKAETFSKFADCRISNGNLQLIDRRPGSNMADAKTELKHVQFEIRRLFGKYFWPFTFSAQIDQPEGLCEISIKGNGQGSLNDWQNCNYSFALRIHNLAPIHLTSYIDTLPSTYGKVDLEMDGDGIPFKQFDGTIHAKTDQLTVKHFSPEDLNILQTEIKTKISVNKEKISWQNLLLKVGGSEFKSVGKIDQWLSNAAIYKAQVDSQSAELEQLQKFINTRWINSRIASLPKDLSFSGIIELSGSILGDYPNKQFINDIVLHNGNIKFSKNSFALNAIDGSMRSDQTGLHIKQVQGLLNHGTLLAAVELGQGEESSIKIKGNNVDLKDIKAILTVAHIQSNLDKIKLDGKIKTFDLSIENNSRQPKINLVLKPAGLVLKDKNNKQVLKIDDGLVTVDDNTLNVNALSGTLGAGSFLCEGYVGIADNACSNIILKAQYLDLKNLEILTQPLGLNNKLFDDQIFSGKLQDIKLQLSGTQKDPVLMANMIADDIVYHPVNLPNALHILDGDIKYTAGDLTLTNLRIKSEKTQFTVSAGFSHCPNSPVLKDMSIDKAIIDLKEINSFFMSSRGLGNLHKAYRKFLEVYKISDIQGKLTGNLFAKNLDNNAEVSMNLALHSTQFKWNKQNISISDGVFVKDINDDLQLQHVKGSINNSIFAIEGSFGNFHNFDNLEPHLKIEGEFYYEDLASLFSASTVTFRSNTPISSKALVSNYNKTTKINFSANLPDNATALLAIGKVAYIKPFDKAFNAEGVLTLRDALLTLGTTQVEMGSFSFQVAGTLDGIYDVMPKLDIKAWIHNPIPIKTMLDILNNQNIPFDSEQITGNMRGGIHISGPVDNLSVSAGCKILDGSDQKLAVKNVDGHIKIAFMLDGKNNNIENQHIGFNLATIDFDAIPIENLTGTADYSINQSVASVNIDNLAGTIADGSLKASAVFKLDSQLPFKIDVHLNDLDSNKLTKQLGGQQNEFKGKVNMSLNLSGVASSLQELIKSLSGSGDFSCTNGHIAKLSILQRKVEEANVLQQGIVGFRASNILGIVEPQENGAFLSADGHLSIENGVVELKKVLIRGQELSLQSSGTIDLNTKQIDLHTIGDIAHVGESGPVGKIVSLTSVAAVADLVSKEVRSKSSMPYSTHPFAFEVNGYLDRSPTIDRSIANSFHWTKKLSEAKIDNNRL